jgi:predicted enzyme related to lactoylglutathione lyase
MPYLQVADCDASTAKAKELGASVMVPPQDIPKTGRFAVLTDPQGAMFAVFKFAGA